MAAPATYSTTSAGGWRQPPVPPRHPPQGCSRAIPIGSCEASKPWSFIDPSPAVPARVAACSLRWRQGGTRTPPHRTCKATRVTHACLRSDARWRLGRAPAPGWGPTEAATAAVAPPCVSLPARENPRINSAPMFRSNCDWWWWWFGVARSRASFACANLPAHHASSASASRAFCGRPRCVCTRRTS